MRKVFQAAFAAGAFLVFLPQPAWAAFTCDTGLLDTTCEVTTDQTLAAGEVVAAAGTLIVRNGGVLRANPTEKAASRWAARSGSRMVG